MIDVKRVQFELEKASLLLESKKYNKEETKKLYELLLKKNELLSKKENIQSNKNKLSKELSVLFKNKEQNAVEIKHRSILSERLTNELEQVTLEFNKIDKTVYDILLNIPNFPHHNAPFGRSEEDNLVVESSLFESADINYLPHWDIASNLKLLDLPAGSKMSGSMFALYRGIGSKLLRSLVQFALDLNTPEYEEIIPPHFISTESFTASGNLPKFADEAYKIEGEELWAIPSAEAALMNLGRDVVYKKSDLTKNIMAYSACFRKEAGSYGKDTRGLLRLHEFHKVELVKYSAKENEYIEFEKLLNDSLRPIKLLKLPYRILNLCTGDLPFSSALTYDIEVYSPGVKRWLEVSSVSLCTDFQTRRGNIRYKDENGKMQFVSGLNGSGLATPRVWAAILENYQNTDGSVTVPEVLQDYLKIDKIQ